MKDVLLGVPGRAPSKAEVCCRLAAQGWRNPTRDEMVYRVRPGIKLTHLVGVNITILTGVKWVI